MKFAPFIILLFIYSFIVNAQNQLVIDSLRVKIEHSADDTSKIKLYYQLSSEITQVDRLKALESIDEALELSLQVKEPFFIAKSYNFKGNSLMWIGKYDDAVENYIAALEIARHEDLPEMEISALNGLGIIKDRLGRFDDALSYYFEALNIFNERYKENSDVQRLRIAEVLYNNIGNIYLSKDELDAAANYYHQGLKTAELIRDDYNIGNICNNLGKLEMQRSNFDSAFVYLQRALDVRQKSGNMNGVAKSCYYLADYYIKTGKLDLAKDFAEKSLEISLNINELQVSVTAYYFLYSIFKTQNNSEKALEYFEKYKDYSDSLINEDNIGNIARLQKEYEFDRIQAEKAYREKRARLSYIITISGLVVLLLFLLLLSIIVLNRHKRITLEKNQLQKDIILKNKELTTNVLYMLKKNELIQDITTRLLTLKSKVMPENREAVQRIIFELQSISEPEVWEEFELRFQNVHEDFYKNLKEKYPDLSPAEIKLAAFLRLNMTTKDIASITGQSINTLETARYRLRKKLGISNQEINLVTFLLDI